ncbi:hypothetical protein ERJ75_000596900 [Trypanosoma vivax]|nr:hypothetical protein ERJ75_000596900 [Trypanosoma vivax]
MFWSLVAAQLIAEPVLAGRRYALRCPQRACCVTGGGCVEAPDAPAHRWMARGMLSTFVASPLRARVCPDLRITVALPASSPRFVFPWWLIPRVLFPRPRRECPRRLALGAVEGARWHHASEHCCALSHCRAHCAVAASSAAYRRCVGALPAISRWRAARCGSPWARGCRLAVRAQWALDAPPLRRVEGDLFGVPQVNVEPLVRDTRSALRRREAETPRRPKRTA